MNLFHTRVRLSGLMLYLFLFILPLNLLAQDPGSKRIGFNNTKLTNVFEQISEKYKVRFIYNTAAPNSNRTITIPQAQRGLDDLLAAISTQANAKFQRSGDQVSVQFLPVKTFTAKGRITDKNMQALPGATVINQRTGEGAKADAMGYFQLNSAQGDRLMVSYIGYKAAGTFAKEEENNFRLEDDAGNLQQVVVTGYMTKKASEVTGSVQKIKGEDLRNSATTADAMSLLKGKVAGFFIAGNGNGGDPTRTSEVVMRGQSGLSISGTGANDGSTVSPMGPLIVLDGMITNSRDISEVANVNDIESITVLKDAASTAIYGSRAAQGVIVITTRRGNNNKAQVSLSAKTGIARPNYGKVRLMNSDELYSFIKDGLTNAYNSNPAYKNTYPTVADFLKAKSFVSTDDIKTNTDWSDLLRRNAWMRDVNLSVTGGNNAVSYFVAFNNYKEDGTRYINSMERSSGKVNLDVKINKRLSASLNLNGLFTNTLNPALGYDQELTSYYPWLSPYFSDGSIADTFAYKNYRGNTVTANPLYDRNYNSTIGKAKYYNGAVKLNYEIAPWLTFSTTNGGIVRDNVSEEYIDRRTYVTRNSSVVNISNQADGKQWGSLQQTTTKTTGYLSSNLLTFKKAFDLHQLTVVAGQEYSRNKASVTTVGMSNIRAGERSFLAASRVGTGRRGMPPILSYSYDKLAFSLFSQADYSYRNKYMASAAFRRDGSSNFGQNNRYGNFFALSGGWLLSSEEFFRQSSVTQYVNNVRVRASYGTSGKEAGQDFLNYTSYVISPASNGYGGNPAAYITQLGNQNLRWEVTNTANLGLEFSVLKRIDFVIDAYNRRSHDLIQQTTPTGATGAPKLYTNVGELINKGLEVSLNTINIQSKDITWTTNLNLSFNKNRLGKIYQDSLVTPLGYYSGNFYVKSGEDLGVIKAIKYMGVNPDNGNALFEYYNAASGKWEVKEGYNQVIANGLNAQQQVAGSVNPKFVGGLSTSLRFRQWTFAIASNFVFGNKIFSDIPLAKQSMGNAKSGNLYAFKSNQQVWKHKNDQANIPAPNADVDFIPTSSNTTTFNLMNGSYWRINNVRLAYQLKPATCRILGITNASMFLSADNLYVFTAKDFVGIDPEVSGAVPGNGTNYSYALPRKVLVGLSVNF
ncbi:SusC/RagA family TonB-linked outer membrane protein [Chitinophaga silvatica]|uniref:SusC/RagA family TonB-linked outer membrane protein n=1 Tax=Chitinophaga silvatica TaxID=2282649 RepID=A0A3E1Y5I1_9BACT|nr:SusC/RagA family TonB-linked outer membrane protein [Chitinophaga silvatica]RFS19994.1 SusC/RagA family TonB-linked outer membrane protein [Chitinophaga silvatica]